MKLKFEKYMKKQKILEKDKFERFEKELKKQKILKDDKFDRLMNAITATKDLILMRKKMNDHLSSMQAAQGHNAHPLCFGLRLNQNFHEKDLSCKNNTKHHYCIEKRN